MKLLKSKKGFTLIELIIVIAILGIIALIAVPNLAGIRQRSQVSADKRTAEQIGKAVRIWATDVDAGATREIPSDAVKLYSDIDGLCETYISSGFNAKSMAGGTAGNYYVYAAEAGDNNATQKILVGISTDGADLNTGAIARANITYDGSAAGWAYLEQ